MAHDYFFPLAARVAVHFNAFAEAFTPHDTIFALSTANELRDASLSAACSLHTASSDSSTSSTTSSLRKRRLVEIAEDEEEAQRSDKETDEDDLDLSAKSPTISIASPVTPLDRDPLSQLPPFSSAPTIKSLSNLETSPPPPREPRIVSPQKEAEPRNSSQSLRPDLSSYSSYGSYGKPKIKLAPRPSLDATKRPHTSTATSFYRPVSTLPAGLKMFSKSGKKEGTRRPSDADRRSIISVKMPPAIPEAEATPLTLPSRPHTAGARPTTSSGASIRAPSIRAPAISTEKARLMKAMELRRKQKNAQDSKKLAADAEKLQPTSEEVKRISSGAPKEVNDTLAMLDDMSKDPDSAIAFDTTATTRLDDSDTTRSDCSHISPPGISDHADSTTASSISEATDETVQQKDHLDDVSRDTKQSDHVASKDAAVSKPNREATIDSVIIHTASFMDSSDFPNQHAGETLPKETHVDATAKDLSETQEAKSPPSPTLSLHSVKIGFEVAPVNTTIPTQLEEPINSDKNQLLDTQSTQETSTSHILPIPIITTHFPSQSNNPGSTGNASDPFLDKGKPSAGSDHQQDKASARRKAHIEPIKTNLDHDYEANLSSDDDLMDELDCAVVQEAKPMSVSKSPMSPFFPSPSPKKRSMFDKVTSRYARSSSVPLNRAESDSSLLHPAAISQTPVSPVETTRSASAGAAYLNRINSQSARPLTKTVAVGSGISQRIKAFEKISVSSESPVSSRPANAASTAFFSVRKADSRPSSSSRSVKDRADSFTRTTPSPVITRETSPAPGANNTRGSYRMAVDTFNSTPDQSPVMGHESISITAKIVRDPQKAFQPSAGGKEALMALDLQKSPLVFQHQRTVKAPQATSPVIVEEVETSSRNSKERRSSATIKRDSTGERRMSLADRRRSITLETSASMNSLLLPTQSSSNNASPTRDGSYHGSPSSTASPTMSSGRTTSPASNTEERSEKKLNRASRMFQRMSASFNSSRKNLSHSLSQPLQEENEPPHTLTISSHSTSPSAMMSPTSIEIGDVNVQFPDTLLWKRRCVMMDPAGYLILSPALGTVGSNKDKAAAGATRKFHFEELARMPSVPDVEMQELPNSVVLDLMDGSGLQIACEDRAGQKVLLNGRSALDDLDSSMLTTCSFTRSLSTLDSCAAPGEWRLMILITLVT